ncbi:hypothetical protein BO94DRAFT_499922 [Aspergillus sclerotioniger CBS 115572]|uniref:Uncharacterized protein n=1 Tax=Aspergillus sclerotioniger CBS 115572 TaxID=1450535 RepID=A0A317VMN8_9EURO|nr:hypothetical protein BO94DRAFT_499922 [Aspergillus sclerotioniger CBS 115572]PWY74491.1 hypothetical protein BO94DRAFT_499922 [Aspergillus sclerotioniger CBS 115572]
MNTIYDHAKNGTLTEQDLQGADIKKLNYLDPKDNTTPLGIAVLNRDFKTAQLLLKHKADPDCLRRGIPPLWRACGFDRRKENVEERLIQLLLNHKADPNLVPEGQKGKAMTPLMKAVKTHKSLEIISSLVDHGADPDAIVNKKSAKDLTTDPKVLNAMLPRATRFKNRAKEVAKVTAFVMSAVFWANKNLKVAAGVGVAAAAGMIAKDAIKRRFKMTGKVDKRLGKYISEDQGFNDAKEQEKDELKNRMLAIIKDNKLDNFFKPDDPFLKEVVERAVDLDRTSPSNVLDPKDLAHLALYQPVLYCDDSASMKQDQRKEHLNDLTQRITSITTRVVPDNEGIELRFINEKTTPPMSKPSLETIDTIMKHVPFDGWTEIGTNLRTKVLQDNVYQHLGRNTLKRPVLVSIITDGHPSGPHGTPEGIDTLRDVIQECGTKLKAHGYDPKVVRFQVSQIGDDPTAKKFLSDLENDHELDDVLYITSERLDTEFKKLRDNDIRLEQWLIELLMGPIVDGQKS